MKNGDKLAVIGPNGVGKTTLLKCLASAYEGENQAGVKALGIKPDAGEIKWGASVSLSFMPQDVREELTQDLVMVDWLKQFAPLAENQVIRALLGRMLFSGEQQEKNLKVLSGGECQRLLLSKMMLEGGNTLVLDEPSNHMDLESIEALGKSLAEFPGAVIFTSHDQDLISRAANRILELRMDGTYLDFKGGYAEFQEAAATETAGKRRQG
jgi:ATPase subunit of ABC transporter with duplicated ATPase domains